MDNSFPLIEAYGQIYIPMHFSQMNVRILKKFSRFEELKRTESNFQVYNLNGKWMRQKKKQSNFHLDSCCEVHFFLVLPVKLTSFISNFQITQKYNKKNENVQLSKVWTKANEKMLALFVFFYISDRRVNSKRKKRIVHSLNIDVCFALCLRFITSSRIFKWYNCVNITHRTEKKDRKNTIQQILVHFDFCTHNSHCF